MHVQRLVLLLAQPVGAAIECAVDVVLLAHLQLLSDVINFVFGHVQGALVIDEKVGEFAHFAVHFNGKGIFNYFFFKEIPSSGTSRSLTNFST